jgi:hypothetical protein
MKDSVAALTAWLQGESDLIAGRLAYLMRAKGVDPKTLICVKMFPDKKDPTGGCVITPQGQVYQFSYNRAGMIFEQTEIDEWINITQTYMNHPWRDEILEGLAML